MSCKDRKNDVKLMAENAVRKAERQNVGLSMIDIFWQGRLIDFVLQIPNPDDVLVITKQGEREYIATLATKIENKP